MAGPDHLKLARMALKVGLGVGPIVTGLDKFPNKLTDWSMYLSPLATRMVPVSTVTFMHAVGLIEILAGIVVLSRWTRIGSLIVMFWLVAIAINLVTTRMFYDLAMRDIEMALGAFALWHLSARREDEISSRSTSQTPSDSIA